MYRPTLSSLLVAALAATTHAGVKPRASTDSPFQVYAYGENIGGMPLVSSGSTAYIGRYDYLNDTEAAPVIFTANENGTWTGAPNTTDLGDSSDLPTWSDLEFSVPAASSSSHTVGLIDPSTNSTSGLITSDFGFYGKFIYVTGSSGDMETLWYAKATDADGLYELRWNTTGDEDEGLILLTLKSTPPSNA
ncbi:hypothetical protein AK830_g11181 [Neonectria ditissima]|uniref:Uncharacterized protein n=1 Tax=Neonectria ditissima TaxID=78410 RepID=A0A0P7B8R3_9HYPO|nr:hypothetical protein AK830_g11181 [Neonectria ditissima]